MKKQRKPEELAPASRKYRRPRRFFSPIGVILGLILGLAGGLTIAWVWLPVEEYDVEPWQLHQVDRAHYIVAIALSHSYDGDVNRAVRRLLDLRLAPDPIQAVADTACQLATTGYVNSTSGLRAIRSMMALYQPQGRAGCADTLIAADTIEPTVVIEIALPTATFTLEPPETKTPTPQALATATPFQFAAPTAAPQRDFDLISVNTTCSAQDSGLIQVFVYDTNGTTGLPGQRVRVRWDEGESIFFTGLKPERGAAYADFEMEAGKTYLVDMPGRSDPLREPLPAVPCTDPTTGERALTTYRVIFRAAF